MKLIFTVIHLLFCFYELLQLLLYSHLIVLFANNVLSQRVEQAA